MPNLYSVVYSYAILAKTNAINIISTIYIVSDGKSVMYHDHDRDRHMHMYIMNHEVEKALQATMHIIYIPRLSMHNPREDKCKVICLAHLFIMRRSDFRGDSVTWHRRFAAFLCLINLQNACMVSFWE